MATDGRGPAGRNRARPASPESRAERPFDVWLNRQLHAMYDEIAKEPLPPELVELIERDGRATAAPVSGPQNAAAADGNSPADKE